MCLDFEKKAVAFYNSYNALRLGKIKGNVLFTATGSMLSVSIDSFAFWQGDLHSRLSPTLKSRPFSQVCLCVPQVCVLQRQTNVFLLQNTRRVILPRVNSFLWNLRNASGLVSGDETEICLGKM